MSLAKLKKTNRLACDRGCGDHPQNKADENEICATHGDKLSEREKTSLAY
nr:hypothetical protein [Bacillus subtilis]MDH3147028.1 hypothetical protein [Bacillus subtilis]